MKAHRNGPKLWQAFPALKERTLWYRINGGKPEHVINERGDHGDEINPPCPVLTPNQWYKDKSVMSRGGLSNAYTCWPPFYRFDEYLDRYPRKPTEPPLCLIHGIEGWGYRDLVEPMRKLGVGCYGVNAPDGLINHRDIPKRLSKALCMVHLKSSDAPGYALYEAMAAGCPIVCTRRLIWRCRMEELLIPGETCLVFDRETHEGLTKKDVEECLAEVGGHLRELRN